MFGPSRKEQFRRSGVAEKIRARDPELQGCEYRLADEIKLRPGEFVQLAKEPKQTDGFGVSLYFSVIREGVIRKTYLSGIPANTHFVKAIVDGTDVYLFFRRSGDATTSGS
jgi:hypothetical protein